MDQIGYCVDSSTWVWCDPIHGISYMDCPSVVGTDCYRQSSTGPAGSCACGAVDTNGVCSAWGSGAANELHFFCSWSGLLFVDNCRAQTGSTTGLCSTLVTSYGYQTDCFCSACTPYDYNTNSCYSAGSSCEYVAGSNACMCY